MKSLSNFIILCNQRTGSEWLRNMLDSHPDIHCSSELLKMWGSGYEEREILKTYFHQAKDKIYGCKVMYNDNIDFENLRGLERNVKIVHLRRNGLDRLVSAYVNTIKDKTGRGAHSTEAEEVYKVRIPEPWFKARLRQDNKWATKYLETGDINIWYEDLVNIENTLLDLQSRLGVERKRLNSGLVKQNPKKLEDFVINLEEVKAIYKAMANEHLTSLYDKFLTNTL